MNFYELEQKINSYEKNYNIKIIGKTILGRNIYAVEKIINEKFSTAIFVAGIHAREYISTDLLCKFLDDGLFDNITDFNISFILMANPDGVQLCYDGLDSVGDSKFRQDLFIANNRNNNFSLWKSNARGVDLNNNFDANFGYHINSMMPSSQGFCGNYAESENETRAIVDYTLSKNVFFTISYHSKGEEIYYNFFQDKKRLKRDSFIAQKFAASTGYLIKNVENVSSGGYKDWCVQKLKIPALTIEIGGDDLKHPIKNEFLSTIYENHKKVAFDTIFAYNIFNKFK